MHPKIDTKIDVEQVCRSMRKCFQNDAKTRSKINDKSRIFRNLRFLFFCEEYNVKLVFSHDQWDQKSIVDAERHRRTPRLAAISGKAIRVWVAGFYGLWPIQCATLAEIGDAAITVLSKSE